MRSWSKIEQGILSAHRVGDYGQCTALAVKFAGPWIQDHLRRSLRSESLVADAFDEWRQLVATSWNRFDPEQRVSAWLYVLARRPRRAGAQEAARRAQLSQEALERRFAQEDREHAPTAPHLRTTVKKLFRELWQELSEQDRQMLELKIDEGCSWEQAAAALNGPEWKPSTSEMKREKGRLMTRFNRQVQRLRDRADELGWLEQYGVDKD